MNEALNKLTYEDCRKSCTDIKLLDALQNQSILVTGGTGFIGKWLTETIVYLNKTADYNIKLYLLGRDIRKFETDVPHLAKASNVILIEQDIKNIHDLPADINYIIHASGSPDNREHVSEPLRTIETFYKGAGSILDVASRLADLKKIIHISSHQVYGINETEEYINESFLGKLETNTVNHVYAESKRAAETLFSIYRTNLRLPVVTIRPFAFIGPYQDLDKPWAINNFIRDCILGSQIRILGNGSTVRSYLYASDMAYWILAATANGEVGETYNLGSRNPISLNSLAEKIRDLIDRNIEIISKSSKESYSNLSRIVPNTEKITKKLKVTESHSLDEAINRTVVWNQLNKK